MKLKRRKPSGREKNQASIKLLEQLREKLHSGCISAARCAAFNLSWMQEDGLDILKEALFSGSSERTKTAAAYGLRGMRGRMKKMAINVLEQGLKDCNIHIRDVCSNALSLISQRTQEKSLLEGARGAGKLEIREIPSKSGQKGEIHKKAETKKSGKHSFFL